MKSKNIIGYSIIAGIILTCGFFLSYSVSIDGFFKENDALHVHDVARLYPTKIARTDSKTSIKELQEVIKDAAQKKLKVSIAGSRHSQGGHIYTQNGVVLDMKKYNRIISIDKNKKQIRVESGATWNDIQKAINPLGLAIKVMQSSYVFTIGGTLSANAHGRDIEKTSVVETVLSFRLLKADGTIVNVSRDENPELFRLTIGGYGLFGVILDVDLQLEENQTYERSALLIDYKDFPEYFEKNIKQNPQVALFLARPSIATDSFMKEIVVTIWSKTNVGVSTDELGEEKNVLRDRILFGLSRDFEWGKNLRWYLQKRFESSPGKTIRISRNNCMRPPATPLKFLDYFSKKNTDIIQEYYVPTRHFIPFMDEFSKILKDSRMNVISSTLRYVKANDETELAYAPKEDAFAIIQMSNVGLSEEEQQRAKMTTQKLVDAATRFGGAYYLTYQLYPTPEQLVKAYPRAPEVFRNKLKYDPEEMFTSIFYETYKEVAR